jgi:predicted RNA-binding protein with PIN domain
VTLAAVPDHLLAPLLDTAGEVLRALDPDEVPPALRPLAGFDRRGLASTTARNQLRRAFDLDDEFRARTVDAFVARAEVGALIDGWSPETAVVRSREAAARDDLPLLAAALYAARPVGYEFVLGVVCNEDQQRRAARALQDDVRAQSTRLATADEARRRAEDALTSARADASRLERELREERRGRRDREALADRQAEDADRRARSSEITLEKARRDLDLAEARARREAERARDAERRLREAKRDASASMTPPAPSPERAVLVDLARRARELADELARTVPKEPTEAAPAAEARRASVPCPPGLHLDQPEALDVMLRTRGVVLVVDGYNVSMRGWPGTPVAQQRNQLLGALERLHLRLRCDVVVVFDGAAVEVVNPRRIPGVRVVFSPEGEAADPVIVREVAALPARVPVLVASNDAWVRDHSARAGATPVTANVLLEVLRR